MCRAVPTRLQRLAHSSLANDTKSSPFLSAPLSRCWYRHTQLVYINISIDAKLPA